MHRRTGEVLMSPGLKFIIVMKGYLCACSASSSSWSNLDIERDGGANYCSRDSFFGLAIDWASWLTFGGCLAENLDCVLNSIPILNLLSLSPRSWIDRFESFSARNFLGPSALTDLASCFCTLGFSLMKIGSFLTAKHILALRWERESRFSWSFTWSGFFGKLAIVRRDSSDSCLGMIMGFLGK